MRIFLSIVCVLGVTSLPLWALEVTATIPPLAFIASAITQGTDSRVTSLLKGGTSPHTQSLKPSHRGILRRADVIVWIGPHYESFLRKLMVGSDLRRTTGNKPVILEVASLSLPYVYPQRGRACCHDHGHHSDHPPTQGIDQHFWLDPRNGAAIAWALSEQFSALDPQNRTQYQKNALLFDQDMQRLHQTLQGILTGVTHRPFYTYHDGYQYFERAYGLSGLGAMAKGHYGVFSLKQMQALKETIRSQGVGALFAERQFSGSTVASLGEALDLPTGLLDPFGENLPIRSESYGVLMTHLASGLAKALRPASTTPLMP